MPQIPRSTFGLLIILVIAFALRFYKIDTYGLYIDEKVTLLVSQAISPEGANQQDLFSKPYFTPKEFWREKNISDFNEAIARGDWGNSAAHYLVLNLWTKIFGLSDFSVRFLSLVFSVLLVFFTFWFVKTHFKDQQLALIAAFLASIEPFFVAQSHIVRNYSMSLFFSLVASHYFLLIVTGQSKSLKTHLLYGFSVTICLFSHYLSFIVFLGHGLYTLLSVRDLKVYVRLVAAMLVPAIALIAWMTIGGGQYSLKTVGDVETFYRNIALHPPLPNPYMGWIDPATPSLVFSKTIKILSDLFLFTNGLSDSLFGYKNLIISVFAGMFSTFCVVGFLGSRLLRFLIFFIGINLLAFLLYSTANFQFVIFSFSLVIIWAFRRQFKKARDEKPLFKFLLIMTFLPLVWMVIQAFKAGHTVGINLRYVGFAIPYAIVLLAIPIQAIIRWESGLRILAYGILAIQLILLAFTLKGIYTDSLPKYTFFSTPRIPNPYQQAAYDITNLYQPGDTIIYPNNTKSVFSAADTTHPPVSVLDAQLVNLYLPKTANFQQRINPIEPNLLILWQKSTQKPKVIFNFEGLKYRY